MFMNRSSPLPVRVLDVEHGNVGSMRAYFFYRQILKLKHILDELIFRGFNGPLLHSFVHHHQDIFL